MTEPRSEPSVGQLVSQLSEQTSRLVRDEMRLAQKELQQSVKHAGIGAGMIGAAGLLAVLGLATLIAGAVAALALVLPVWASAVIVAAVPFCGSAVLPRLPKSGTISWTCLFTARPCAITHSTIIGSRTRCAISTARWRRLHISSPAGMTILYGKPHGSIGAGPLKVALPRQGT